MRYGVTLGAYGDGRDPRGLARLAALAEDRGWDAMFLEDYLVYQGMTGGPTYDTWICLAAMATATERLRLGTTVAAVPRRRPWELAAAAVALDQLSGGRLILGAGAGDLNDPGGPAGAAAAHPGVDRWRPARAGGPATPGPVGRLLRIQRAGPAGDAGRRPGHPRAGGGGSRYR
jgi:alkanesulfonate monooxygenase SsuD/methylene tetrahydromethanopterin reductase-like flavin-dependent oxidoreductase (luciferase family)